MNELIESLFNNFTVDGVSIPVSYMYYEGHGEPYVTYQETGADQALCGDDDLIAYVDFYDFDIFSKGNYNNIIQSVKSILINNGFTWQVSGSSFDMYEPETGYYHKTLSFAIPREEINDGENRSF